MAVRSVREESLKQLAQAIREKSESTALLEFPDGMENAVRMLRTKPELQHKAVMPAQQEQTVCADNGYDGLAAVTVQGDEELAARNIRRGVEIFGIKGSYVGEAETEVETSVTLFVHGSGFMLDGCGPMQGMVKRKVPINATVQLEYVGTENFLHWLNGNDNILADGARVTEVLITAETHIQAVSLSTALLGTAAPYGAYVEFLSAYGQVMDSGVWFSDDAQDEHVLPEGPGKLSTRFIGWTMNGETVCSVQDILDSIDGSEAYIPIYGLYEDVVVPITITVRNNLDDATAEYTCNRGKGVLLSPPPGEREGYVVAGWSLDAEGTKRIGAYASGCGVFPVQDITVYVQYVPVGTPVSFPPVCWMSGVYIDEGVPNSIFCTVVREVPAPYKIIQTGVLYARNGAVQRETAEQTMVIGSAAVQLSFSTSTTRRSAYTLRNNLSSAQTLAWMRGYLIYADAENVQHILYTDVVDVTYAELAARNKSN